ncbi:hypothetical protein ACPA54_12940 [Uniformispora flossi]|uniref:hypothetical protein n=1 Tax=Uniformispora flossi TaxID=3390723 RepID=UPI003C2D1398
MRSPKPSVPLEPSPGLWVRPVKAGMYPEGVILYVVRRGELCLVQCEEHDTKQPFVAERAQLHVIPSGSEPDDS